jgi:pyruvate formate lyase activating enzyme
MNIAGFVPLSLCDYPGRVAAVVFTQGCNYRCPWCHNGHLLPLTADPAKRVSEAQVLAVLEERRNRLGGVVVSGGEPTLQLALPRFLRRLKALGLDVKLDTNGSHPNVLRQLLEDRLLDYVAMDVKAPWDRYAALTGMAGCNVAAVQASMTLIAASGVPHAFRTTRE